MSLFQKSILNRYYKTINDKHLNQSYDVFVNYFHNSKIQENIRAANETQFQQKFLIELFVNVFGYIMNPDENWNLTTEFKNEEDAKKADGAILKNNKKSIAVIELKGTETTELDSINKQASYPTDGYHIGTQWNHR